MALRSRSRAVMEILARGEAPGPESSVSKVLADRHRAAPSTTWPARCSHPDLDLGTADELDFWQEHYLYSRASSSIYGGSRQIQLNVIGKLMVTRGSTSEASRPEEEQALRSNVAEAIERAGDGRSALDGLDWWSFAGRPADAFGRAAFSAWFEHQGAQLATSPALAGTSGVDVAAALGEAPETLALAVGKDSEGLLVTGFDAATRTVVDASGRGVRAIPVNGATASPSRAFDAELVVRVAADVDAARDVDIDTRALDRSRSLARIGIACEILGASRHLLGLAIAHANEREQFGQPIARFQAIQHMISECQIEVSTLEALCRAALEEWSVGDGTALATLVKAQAGRDGRAIAQRALQCFGAIGFTAEHPHNLYSRRIHTLDVLLGDYASLRRQLGRDLVATGHAPRGVQAWRPEDPTA